jgi:transposase
MPESKPKRPTPRKCPPELRERAVRLVREAHQEDPGLSQTAAHERIGKRLGVHHETLRTWVRQAEVDTGRRPGTTTAGSERIKALEREVKELRRANEILLAASSFFARELGPRLPR